MKNGVVELFGGTTSTSGDQADASNRASSASSDNVAVLIRKPVCRMGYTLQRAAYDYASGSRSPFNVVRA